MPGRRARTASRGFAEWADRYAGRFDMGYEAYREIVLANQKKLGIVPADTELSPMNPYLGVTGPDGQPWPAGHRPAVGPLDDEGLAVRADGGGVRRVHELYRRPDRPGAGYLEESGQLDNTIIVVISDNGASGEGGPNGSVNEVKFFNGYLDTVADGMRLYDSLGGPQTYNHYPIGWAMAFNTPYKLFKRYLA